MKHRNTIIMLSWIVLFFIFDRITKFIFFNGKNNKDFGWVALTFVKNTGASFGILQNNNLLLIGVAIAAFGIVLYYRKDIPKWPFVLLTAGIMGNLCDRIAFGYVVDFINFKFFPVFNVADSLITIAVAVWILMSLFKKN